MTDSSSKRRAWKFRILRWFVWTIALVVLLVVAILLVIQTRPFKNWLRDFAVSKANESLNGELSIGSLDGNLLGNIELSDLAVSLDDDTVATAASIRAYYDLFALLDGTIQVDSVAIDSPYMLLRQSEDSSWNLSRLVLPDTAVAPPEDSSESGFGYAIALDNFWLTGATADVRALDSIVPDRVDRFDIDLEAHYTEKAQRLSMRRFQVHTIGPELTISNLTFEAVSDTKFVNVDDFVLQSAMNVITATATVSLDDIGRSRANVVADSVRLSEFREFLPPHIKELGPVLSLNAELNCDTLVTLMGVVAGKQTIELTFRVNHVSAALDSAAGVSLDYTAEISMKNVVLAQWADNPELDMLINGLISIAGTGVDLQTARANIKGDFRNCVIRQQRVTSLAADARYNGGRAQVALNAGGVFGRANLKGALHDLFGIPTYECDLRLVHFDLSKIVTMDTLPTDLNLELSAKGSGLSLDSLVAEAAIVLSPSTILDLLVDSSYILVNYAHEELLVDTFTVATSAITADMAGLVRFDGRSDLRYTVRLEDASMLASLSDSSLLGGHGLIAGNLSGTPDSLSMDANLEFSALVLSDAVIAELRGDLSAEYRDSAIAADGWIQAIGIEAGGMPIDTLTLFGQYDEERAEATLDVVSIENFHIGSDLRAVLDSVIEVVVQRLVIDYGGTNWRGGSDSTLIRIIDDSTYAVHNLGMLSDGSDTGQFVQVGGVVSLSAESDLNAEVRNLSLSSLAAMFDMEFGGKLSANLDLSGTADNPRAEGKLAISDGWFERFEYHSLSGALSYIDQLASFGLNFKPTIRDSLTVSGSIVMPFSLVDTSVGSLAADSVEVRIVAEGLPMDVLKAAGYYVEEADGLIACDLLVTNTLEDPHVSGKLDVLDGQITVPTYGINYKDIAAGVTFQPKSVTVDSLVVRENKGKLHVSGQVVFDSSFVTGNLASSRMDMIAENFYAVSHRDYEVQISSSINLEGTQKEAAYGGMLTVNRSRFNLAAFMEMPSPDPLDEASLPMLVAATMPDTAGSPDSSLMTVSANNEDTVASAFLENLRGSVKISIPRNTWIKSPDLKLELSGDIDVVKDGPDFELFGNVGVVRGHYQLYGKRFTVKRGQLIFQGGADFTAGLDIQADYVFRTATREKKTLRLLVTGTSEMPVVKFRLDDVDLAEGDAVSYILFGRSLDELTQGQRSTVAGGSESGSVAGQAAASLLAGQLSQALGNKLNLDVIEIKAQGDLQSAAVVVGKYLTPDLFMSYQRSFGSVSDDDLEPETVTLEYQLTRLVYLQLTEGDAEEAGFDIIFKVTMK